MAFDYITGAIDGVDDNLLRMTQDAWQQILPGARIEVTTGVSNHSPTNHAPGHAVDYRVVRPDGSAVLWNDPEAQAASQLFWELGGHGVGAGPTYMGGSHFHWDVSANGVRAWSDDDGGASDRGPGAAQWFGGQGAGSTPSYNPSRPPSVFNPPPGSPPPQNALAAYDQGPADQQNALAMMDQFQPRRRNMLDPADFMVQQAPIALLPMPGIST